VQKFDLKVVGIINLCKKLIENKVNDLDNSIEKIGIGINHSHSFVFFQWIKTYNILTWLTLMHIQKSFISIPHIKLLRLSPKYLFLTYL